HLAQGRVGLLRGDRRHARADPALLGRARRLDRLVLLSVVNPAQRRSRRLLDDLLAALFHQLMNRRHLPCNLLSRATRQARLSRERSLSHIAAAAAPTSIPHMRPKVCILSTSTTSQPLAASSCRRGRTTRSSASAAT